MMRKFISYILFFCAVATLNVSCYDDKGNYDYIDVTEVRIDTTGLKIMPAYAISRFDHLSIAPNIYYNGKLVNESTDAPLNYLWTIYSAATGSGVDYTVDTLSTTRVLDAEISRSPGSYYVRLTVTNEENDLQTFFKVTCSVEGTIAEGGILVMYERADKPGYSDVGLVVNSFTKRNLIQEREYWNLYGNSNGGPLEGKPTKVYHTVCALPEDLVVLTTDKTMVAVNKATFGVTLNYEDFFYEAPPAAGVSAYMQAHAGQTGEVLISNNKLYYKQGNRNVLLGVAKVGDYGELAPWLCLYHANLAFESVVYDQTAGCFLYIPYKGVKFTHFITQSSEAAFDVSNVGAELIEGDWGRNNHEYLLMKKDNGYYLAVANFQTTNTSSTNIGQGWYDMSSSPNISKVTSMSASAAGLYIVYGAGSSVYNFGYTTNLPAAELWKAPSADEEVTCVKLQKFDYQLVANAFLPNANAVLHIATWNENTQEGKLYQYQINPASGALIGEPKTYTVPGKVKSMNWKYVMGG